MFDGAAAAADANPNKARSIMGRQERLECPHDAQEGKRINNKALFR